MYPTFFVLKGNDGVRAGEFNVFEVQESFEEVLFHSRTSVSELKDGSLLVKAQCVSDSRALSKLFSVANRPVASSPHNRLNSCQGIIFCRKLLGMSPEYLVQKLRPQHVSKVYRFRSKVNGTLLIPHVYCLPSMPLNSHPRYMMVTFPLTFDNLCRDHVGVLNARSMTMKLKIVDLHFQ